MGTNFHQPLSLILDDLGIYYDPNQPSRLELILENEHFDQHLLDRAAALIELITSSNITKYNLGSKIERVEIYSKTAMEIAISIAGEMILKRNKALPTGRTL